MIALGDISSTVQVRRFADDDLDEVLDLFHLSLGWERTDRFRDFFVWKHRTSPFGPSPGWVAVVDEQIVGIRLFLPWEFSDGERTVRAVRAVDTATHPDHQGKGIFRSLTMTGLEELEAEGVGFVFNTPNDQSRPGYLKMGWKVAGRVPVAVLPAASPRSLWRMRSARTGAERWPLPTDLGEPAVFDEEPPPTTDRSGLQTCRSLEFLRWRYGWSPLGYRTFEHGPNRLIGRLRRRGEATELAVADALTTSGRRSWPAWGVLREAHADHLLCASSIGPALGAMNAPLGPLLTLRSLCEEPTFEDLHLTLGDVELF